MTYNFGMYNVLRDTNEYMDQKGFKLKYKFHDNLKVELIYYSHKTNEELTVVFTLNEIKNLNFAVNSYIKTKIDTMMEEKK